MARSIAIFVFLVVAVGAASAAAQEITRTFERPSINGVRVDWCRFYGSECGAPAAELFCQQKGFARALRFSMDPRIGAAGLPTVVSGEGRLCRAAGCSGFEAITCARPATVNARRNSQPRHIEGQAAARHTYAPGPPMITINVNRNTTRFRYPHVGNMRLDWCRNWGSNCGEPAADLFCRQMGFAKANRFVIDEATGPQGIPSLVIGDRRVCDARYCNAFKLIACTHRQAPQAIARQVDTQQQTQLAFAAPVPTPKPPLQPDASQAATPVAQPRPAKPAADAVEPAVEFASFEPLAPTVVAVNWVNLLDTVDRYPEGASLFQCADSDCSTAKSADFAVDPDAEDQTVQLNFRVDEVPHASGALWQISYLPFPAFARGSEADLSPQGLLDYQIVNIRDGWFDFDLQDFAKDLPGGEGPAILHVRVLPVSEAGLEQVVGKPSNTMRIFYGADLPSQPPYEAYAKQEVPDSRPKVRMAKLDFKPLQKAAQWPPGCKAEADAVDEVDEPRVAAAYDAMSESWGWNSKSYQWMKTRVVDITGGLVLNRIPDNALEFALNSALVSAGIPPDIANMNDMMRNGVDGLSRGFAKTAVQQIAAADLASTAGSLAADISDEAASAMNEEELRLLLEKEIEDRSRKALLQTADEFDTQLAGDGDAASCTTDSFQGVYEVTVENTGQEHYRDLSVSVAAAPVYLEHTWTVDLAPGETVKLVAVGSPKMPNGPYSDAELPPGDRAKEDMNRWWTDIVNDEEVEIEVSLPGALECLGGDPGSQFCQRERFVAHKSPPQLVTEAYEFTQ